MNADSQSPGDQSPLDLRGLNIGLLSSSTEVADAAEALITRRYQFAPVDEAEILVALGGLLFAGKFYVLRIYLNRILERLGLGNV